TEKSICLSRLYRVLNYFMLKVLIEWIYRRGSDSINTLLNFLKVHHRSLSLITYNVKIYIKDYPKQPFQVLLGKILRREYEPSTSCLFSCHKNLQHSYID